MDRTHLQPVARRWLSRVRVIALATVVGVLAACAARPPELPRPLRAPKADAPTGEVLGDAASGRTHPQMERGPEPVRREQAAQQPERAQSRIPPMQRSEPVAIALDGVPLETFINIVYGMELGLPVQIDQSLRGRPELLSLSLAKPMPPEQAFRVAEEVLRSYNVRIDELGGVLRFTARGSAHQRGQPAAADAFAAGCSCWPAHRVRVHAAAVPAAGCSHSAGQRIVQRQISHLQSVDRSQCGADQWTWYRCPRCHAGLGCAGPGSAARQIFAAHQPALPAG